ncbi:MAG TPA: lasso peptide biosynthesis B2 protein [Sphingomicrobium sp.]|jgi:hypothetical protein|nr:lasso peptide biosynthesis B2 protein [Sphingomicrobium sp.]
MQLRLREQLHWCDCGGRTVFLDVRADRYFCLAGPTNEAFLRLARGRIEEGDSARLKGLIDRGLLVDDPDCGMIPAPCTAEPASSDLIASRRRLLPFLGVLVSELRAMWMIRHLAFADLLRTAAAGKAVRPPSDPVRCARMIAAAAASVALLTGATDRCLVRALAVHWICRRRGLRSSLVFGVRLNPFAAHCWVQVGASVIVGEFEQARLYTPIMVLE